MNTAICPHFLHAARPQACHGLAPGWLSTLIQSTRIAWRSLLLAGALFLAGVGQAVAAPEWMQVGHVRNAGVCAPHETGLGDTDLLAFHPFSNYMVGDDVVQRLRIQRNSTVAIRLIGHGADLANRVSMNVKEGLSASITGKGLYWHQPRSSGPVGFVEITLRATRSLELNTRSLYVHWPWPMGSQRIALRLVERCDVGEPVAIAPVPSRCFGAVGMQCGLPVGGLNVAAVCTSGRCHYNGGSLIHDKCCATAPYGHACGGAETFVSGEQKCRPEMDRAVAMTAANRSWIRETDFNLLNTTGEWDRAAVCAPTGTIVDRGDRSKCCANMGVAPSAPTDSERLAAHNNPTVMGYISPGPGQRPVQPASHVCE
jgi:hypothetical protein